ncbi:MAG: 16S rRNA (guanine527-N7)-methyltransferase [Bacteroidia bacterium]|jgi:16S rRNA (guanine527-N7)-methyltransferase
MSETPVSWEIILKYFDGLTDKQKQQFEALYDVFLEWNTQINVVSRKDFHLFYERHVLHSLAIATIVDFEPGTKILDVGTGGGFPGIPLAIMFPECDFMLVDSIGKKIKVANGVADSIGLKNVKAVHGRMEEGSDKYDVVVTRAVARLGQLKHWLFRKLDAKSKSSVKGLICLKGGDLTEEIIEAKVKANLYNLSDTFKEEFFETKKVVWIPKF